MVFAAAAVLASCSNEEVTPAIDGKDVQITLNSTTIEASGLSTRAPFEGTIGASNQLVARVIASDKPDFSTEYANGTMTFVGSEASYDLGAEGTTTYPAAAPVYLFGLYPEADWTYADGEADCTFTGKEDVMATSQINTVATDVTTSSYKNLAFKHLLTKLEVKMNATSAAIAAFGNITSIKLTADGDPAGVNNKVKVGNKTTTMIPTFSSSVSALDFYGLSVDGTTGAKTYSETVASDFALTTSSTSVAYAMVAPVTAVAGASAEYTLQIETVGAGIKTIAVDLKKLSDGSAFTGNTAGYSFGVSISFISINEITATVSVDEWRQEGEFEGKITNE